MLNKDQYNQDEYNNYYKQESTGTDIQDPQEQGGVMGKLLLLLGLVALAIAGYFGFKMFGSTETTDTTTKEILVQEEITKAKEATEELAIKAISNESSNVEVEKTTKEKVTLHVQDKLKNDGLSDEELEKAVDSIMEKMDEEKKVLASEDNNLINALSQSDVEHVNTTSDTTKQMAATTLTQKPLETAIPDETKKVV